MTYAFTKREKIMLVVLAVIIIALGYFKLILEPINEKVDRYNSMAAEEQIAVSENLTVISKIRRMQEAIDEAKNSGNYSPIPTYDNSKDLLNELYTILDSTVDYQLNFGAVAEDGYVMLRPISMTFNSTSYEEARGIIDKLHDSKNLNQISDVIIETGDSGVSTTLRVTYFEVLQ